jgi:NTP pyrophosphatase (non-canonical NTP hydrolase)
MSPETAIEVINKLRDDCHETACEKGWWDESRNKGELIALMHSELSEALEWMRKESEDSVIGGRSDHIPDFFGIEEEFADVLVRIFDFCGGYDLDIGGALLAKMAYNQGREYKHGKKF